MTRQAFRPGLLLAFVAIAAAAGGYVGAPVLYFYSTDTVENRDGDTVPVTGNLDAALFGVGYSQVTTKKIFGSRHERASPRVS